MPGLRLSSAVPKIQWVSNPIVPTVIRLLKTFPFNVETQIPKQSDEKKIVSTGLGESAPK